MSHCYADPVTTKIVVVSSDRVFRLKSLEEIKNPAGEIFLAVDPRKRLTEVVTNIEIIMPVKYYYSEDIDPNNLIIIPIEIIDNTLYLL